MMSSGCETFQAGNVALPADCETLGAPAKAPVPQAGDDSRTMAARYAAWGADNKKRLEKQTECTQRVREDFSKGGVK